MRQTRSESSLYNVHPYPTKSIQVKSRTQIVATAYPTLASSQPNPINLRLPQRLIRLTLPRPPQMLTLAPKQRRNQDPNRRHSEADTRGASPRLHNVAILAIEARGLEIDVVTETGEEVQRVAPASVRGAGDLV